ncbi:hypothetical protein ONE63_011328 [Megalurothrips usitatus]|uniref:Uncharacterized protein n=1 Tax=Megalurothrips usitatus TaxID=439358 RepID=A0AAV7X0C5_9NEOP|nr:hypothetical protein ONE63_011328 [Megalurothrips usitatus]
MEVYLNHKFEENIETSEITEAINNSRESSKNVDRPTTGGKRPKSYEELRRTRNTEMNNTFESFSASLTSTPCNKRKTLSQPLPAKRSKKMEPTRSKSSHKNSKRQQNSSSSEEDEEVGKDEEDEGNQDDDMAEEEDQDDEEEDDEEDEDSSYSSSSF